MVGDTCWCQFSGMRDPVNDASTFEPKASYTYEDLLACGHGTLFGPGNAKLPLPPMLMFDRIVSINKDGGSHGKGELIAELDIKPELWFFECHFENDPVMPGCLGLDAMWQLLGFFLGWMGLPGRGRALSCGKVKFSGMVLPDVSKLSFHLDIKRLINRRLVMGIADAIAKADGETVFAARVIASANS